MPGILREALEKARLHYIRRLTTIKGAIHTEAELCQLPLSELKEMWKAANTKNHFSVKD